MDQSLIEEYTAFNQFLIRTPLFPLNFIDSFEENTIKSILNNPVIKEAIYLASPILYSEIEKWLDGEIRSEKEVNRILFSSLRYLIRMSTRCTPFGLFAGCSIGRWNNSDLEKSILLSKQSTYTSHTRLDMQYLCSLAQNLAKEELIKYNLLFYPNSSIYKQGNQLRYVEYKYINNRRIHQLVSVDNSEYLYKILVSCRDGLKIYNLASLLIDEEISFDEALNYILELIDSQILISELEPALTGPEFLEQILIVLNANQGLES